MIKLPGALGVFALAWTAIGGLGCTKSAPEPAASAPTAPGATAAASIASAGPVRNDQAIGFAP